MTEESPLQAQILARIADLRAQGATLIYNPGKGIESVTLSIAQAEAALVASIIKSGEAQNGTIRLGAHKNTIKARDTLTQTYVDNGETIEASENYASNLARLISRQMHIPQRPEVKHEENPRHKQYQSPHMKEADQLALCSMLYEKINKGRLRKDSVLYKPASWPQINMPAEVEVQEFHLLDVFVQIAQSIATDGRFQDMTESEVEAERKMVNIARAQLGKAYIKDIRSQSMLPTSTNYKRADNAAKTYCKEFEQVAHEVIKEEVGVSPKRFRRFDSAPGPQR